MLCVGVRGQVDIRPGPAVESGGQHVLWGWAPTGTVEPRRSLLPGGWRDGGRETGETRSEVWQSTSLVRVMSATDMSVMRSVCWRTAVLEWEDQLCSCGLDELCGFRCVGEKGLRGQRSEVTGSDSLWQVDYKTVMHVTDFKHTICKLMRTRNTFYGTRYLFHCCALFCSKTFCL